MEYKILSVRIDGDLHRRFKAKVASQGLSMTSLATDAISRWVGDWGDRTERYVVRPGDTLAKISQRFYGDTSNYLVIAYFNDIVNPALIEVGQELLIPEPSIVEEIEEPLRPGESPYLFGLHDAGGEHLMAEAGRPGWVIITEDLGHDPNNRNGKSYTSLRDRGFGVIARLNNGYRPNGTIPHERHYDAFAQRCANFVAHSPGCHIWIIGNEPNLRSERPGWGTPDEETITPQRYADSYKRCRRSIKALSGHAQDQVIVAAVGPWNPESGYWIQYFEDILAGVGDECDGIALHTYSHQVRFNPDGSHDNLITDETQPWAHLPGAHFNFRAYRDFMAAIPLRLRHLPVYITETNQDRDAHDPKKTWFPQNLGWVQEAYAEINGWNSVPGNQKIRCLALYRWSTDDPWGLADNSKPGVIEDFRTALQHDYRWHR